ncbi:alcohol dehydrogenase family protein [Alteromonas lipotrueiana]|uniref:alcohol dehydrogenase family protein n=1 Tax=Alteromonas lipotrueiana TaxID=2803815 RepID=UPI001C4708E8|nr:alcohol dehydrogenase family protein [Alteromonas lipotrueiana]
MANLPTTMHGVQLTGYGDYDVLNYATDIAVPSLASSDVLIKVMAAGVNNTDLNTRLAWYAKEDQDENDASWSGGELVFPRIQGADVCGVVVAVGEEVDKSRIGERVLIEPCLVKANGETLSSPWYFGSECDGGFAQYTVVDSFHAYKINSRYSDVELASFPCSYSTAENMLYRSNPQQGQTVLITGASGGVGSAAVQLAKARGANVIAVTSESKSQKIKELGADKIVLRDDDLVQSLGKNSVDVVVDLVAGKQWPTLLEVLKPKGRYAVSGAIGGALVELDVRTLYLKDLTFFGCTVIEPEVFKSLIDFIEQEKIKPIVAQTFPLNEIVTSQQVFAQKQHVGKIVLTIPHDE